MPRLDLTTAQIDTLLGAVALTAEHLHAADHGQAGAPDNTDRLDELEALEGLLLDAKGATR